MRHGSETRPGTGWGDNGVAGERDGVGRIGRGIRIKGMVRGKEDLVVEGEVEGSISLPEHHVMLERPSRTAADVRARNATLRGRHRGNATASDKIEITSEGCVIGDLFAPRLVIQEGARFRGKIDMEIDLPAGLLTPSDSRPAEQANEHKKDGKRKGKQHVE